jgi:hypothetical protein
MTKKQRKLKKNKKEKDLVEKVFLCDTCKPVETCKIENSLLDEDNVLQFQYFWLNKVREIFQEHKLVYYLLVFLPFAFFMLGTVFIVSPEQPWDWAVVFLMNALLISWVKWYIPLALVPSGNINVMTGVKNKWVDSLVPICNFCIVTFLMLLIVNFIRTVNIGNPPALFKFFFSSLSIIFYSVPLLMACYLIVFDTFRNAPSPLRVGENIEVIKRRLYVLRFSNSPIGKKLNKIKNNAKTTQYYTTNMSKIKPC